MPTLNIGWMDWLGDFGGAAMNQVVQDHAGRIRGVPVGVEPRAIQQGKGKIFVAEEDLDLGVGYRQRTNPVRLVVGSQKASGSGLVRHASDSGQVGIAFGMQIPRVTSPREGLLEDRTELLFDRLTK